jgi:hypothetical protein
MRIAIRATVTLLLLLLYSAPHAAVVKGDYWAEAQISEARPYVQQSLVYMILVISKISLERVEHSPPSIAGIALERLDEQPLNYPFNMEGRRYNITAFRYALTPLTLGTLDIPPAKVKITPGQRPYTWPGNISRTPIELETNPLSLEIQPPVAGAVKNWLPLISLKINAQFDKPATLKVGEPFTLTLIQDSTGAGGENLPGLASFLHNDDFKIYPERPVTSREVVPDGSILVLSGQRKEVYTLIPQREGQLNIPSLEVHWWDVRKKQAATAFWNTPPIRVGDTAASSSSTENSHSGDLSLPQFYAWMAVQAVFMFLCGWWVGRGFPGAIHLITATRLVRNYIHTLFLHWMHSLRQRFQRDCHVWQTRLQPYVPASLCIPGKTLLARIGHWLVPRRVRMWWHLRHINECETSSICARCLRDFAHDYLDLPPNSTLPRIAQTLCQRYPRLERDIIISLMRELDGFMYAAHSAEDLIAWQSAFIHASQYLPLYRPHTPTHPSEGLPLLNPLA